MSKELHLPDYQAVKQKTAWWVQNKAPSILTPEFLRIRPRLQIFQDNKARAMDTVLHNLTTDRAYADEVIMELTALAHDVFINVESLTRPGNITQFEPLTGTNKRAHLLIREDKATGIYRLTGSQVHFEAWADGHIWRRVDPSAPPGNGRGPAGALP
jgi:hypothetical protein